MTNLPTTSSATPQVPSATPPAPLSTQAYQIKEKLLELEASLLTATPNMPTLLRTIHSQLKKDPDLVTILTEEECAILVNGLKKQTATAIATVAPKKASKKAMSKLTVDDL